MWRCHFEESELEDSVSEGCCRDEITPSLDQQPGLQGSSAGPGGCCLASLPGLGPRHSPVLG